MVPVVHGAKELWAAIDSIEEGEKVLFMVLGVHAIPMKSVQLPMLQGLWNKV